MQQLTLTINNPEVEKMLLDLSKNNNKSVNHIASDIVEGYLSSYQVVRPKKDKQETTDDFFKLMRTKKISLLTDDITREWIHDNPERNDLHRQ